MPIKKTTDVAEQYSILPAPIATAINDLDRVLAKIRTKGGYQLAILIDNEPVFRRLKHSYVLGATTEQGLKAINVPKDNVVQLKGDKDANV